MNLIEKIVKEEQHTVTLIDNLKKTNELKLEALHQQHKEILIDLSRRYQREKSENSDKIKLKNTEISRQLDRLYLKEKDDIKEKFDARKHLVKKYLLKIMME